MLQTLTLAYQVSVQFGAFHTARRYFEGLNAQSHPTGDSSLSLRQYYTAGAIAGVTNSVLSGPIEHVRIRLQTQPHATSPSARLYSGPWSCIQTLVQRGGVFGGLFRGQAVTVLREAQAYGCWFLTYESLMGWEVKRRGLESRKSVEAWKLALFGGIAGEALWISSYPFDVVKSRMQADGVGAPADAAVTQGAGKAATEGAAAEREALVQRQLGTQKYKSMRDCFAITWREAGFRGFWAGIGPTLVRAMPVSAATFVV